MKPFHMLWLKREKKGRFPDFSTIEEVIGYYQLLEEVVRLEEFVQKR
jgi:hypothetical protein